MKQRLCAIVIVGAVSAVLFGPSALAIGDPKAAAAAPAPDSFAVGDQLYIGKLTGAQEEPAVVSDAIGASAIAFDCGRREARVFLFLEDIADVTGVHLHCGRAGETGPVVVGLMSPGPCELIGRALRCTLTNADISSARTPCGPDGLVISNIAALEAAMRQGLLYLNVHTLANPGGEVRGQPMALPFPNDLNLTGLICDLCKIQGCGCWETASGTECVGC